MEKEKTIPITIRIPASLLEEITEMAKFYGVTRNKMLSTIVQSGKVIADSLQESEDIVSVALKGVKNG